MDKVNDKTLEDIEIDLSDIVDELCKLNEQLEKMGRWANEVIQRITLDKIISTADYFVKVLDGALPERITGDIKDES